MSTVKILYFDKKSIFTIDFSFLFKILLDSFPGSELRFIEMDEEYKLLCAEEHQFDMIFIKTRFMIFEDNNRREDLEDLVIQLGIK